MIEDEIWTSLNLAQKEMIKEENFYKNSFDYKKIAQSTDKKHSLVNQNSLDSILDDYESIGDLC